MTLTIDATYENGILKPKQPLTLANGTEVRLSVDILDENYDPLEEVIGIGDGPPDGADNHDNYVNGVAQKAENSHNVSPDDEEYDPLVKVIGICDSGRKDGAQNHDKYIYGDLRS